MNIAVAANRAWVAPIVNEVFGQHDHAAIHITTPEELLAVKERPIFFIHWSHIIPENELDGSMVGFHMTDLPYGRGGSPLQNLILRGHTETVLTAFQMTADPDAGPVYMKRPLTLEGTAQEIFERAARLAAHMIVDLVPDLPDPRAQENPPPPWPRRTPNQSRLPEGDVNLYDFIRMLDADGYPHAFLDYGPWRLEFTDAKNVSEGVRARVVFRRRE